MSKKIFFLLVLAMTLVLTLLIVRFASPEDTWLCQDGSWIRHGNPDGAAPTTVCPGAVVENTVDGTENTETPETAVGDWQTYQNQELGFQFSYPKEFGDFTLQNYSTQLKGKFSNEEINFRVGGITKDYSSPREGYYMDFSGWKKEGENYFWGFVGEIYNPITPKKVLSENIILVDCMSFEDKCHQTGPSASVPSGNIAGLINLKEGNFPGLIFYTTQENEDFLLQILSTFKFLDDNIGMANPASVNCTDKGGTLAIEKRPDGGEFGVCYFEDNYQCEEWALMRDECPVGGRKITGYVTEAGRYCAITGGEYLVTDESDPTNEKGTCTLADGQVCEAEAYYAGTCPTNQ